MSSLVDFHCACLFSVLRFHRSGRGGNFSSAGQLQLHTFFYTHTPLSAPAAAAPLLFLVQLTVHPATPPATSPLCLASAPGSEPSTTSLQLLHIPFQHPLSWLFLLVQAGVQGSYHTGSAQIIYFTVT